MKLRTAISLTFTAAVLAACGTPSSGSAKPAPADSFVQPGPSSVVPAPSPSTSGVVFNAKFGQPYDVSLPTFTGGTEGPPDTYTVTVTAPVVAHGLLGTPHGQYISFTVTIKATSEGISTNPMYFYVRDAAGTHHNAGSTGEETLSSNTMHTGESLTGTIIADVPTPHGVLAYDPIRGGPGGSLVEWPF